MDSLYYYISKVWCNTQHENFVGKHVTYCAFIDMTIFIN
jgi:hypothetical protein